jgi:hypothetical protein
MSALTLFVLANSIGRAYRRLVAEAERAAARAWQAGRLRYLVHFSDAGSGMRYPRRAVGAAGIEPATPTQQLEAHVRGVGV